MPLQIQRELEDRIDDLLGALARERQSKDRWEALAGTRLDRIVELENQFAQMIEALS